MIKLYTDAATKGNPGPSGAGVIILHHNEQQQLTKDLGHLSNHQAEFQALLFGLTALKKLPKDEGLLLFTDSKIVAQSIEKQYAKHFQTDVDQILKLLAAYSFFTISWIPQSQNKGAHHLAQQALRKIAF